LALARPLYSRVQAKSAKTGAMGKDARATVNTPIIDPRTRGVTNAFYGALIPGLLAMRLSMAVESHVREIADKHQRIQELIEAEMNHSAWDEVRVAALKKEKLRLKDELERLRTQSH
jgi:hypothetical protein